MSSISKLINRLSRHAIVNDDASADAEPSQTVENLNGSACKKCEKLLACQRTRLLATRVVSDGPSPKRVISGAHASTNTSMQRSAEAPFILNRRTNFVRTDGSSSGSSPDSLAALTCRPCVVDAVREPRLSVTEVADVFSSSSPNATSEIAWSAATNDRARAASLRPEGTLP